MNCSNIRVSSFIPLIILSAIENGETDRNAWASQRFFGERHSLTIQDKIFKYLKGHSIVHSQCVNMWENYGLRKHIDYYRVQFKIFFEMKESLDYHDPNSNGRLDLTRTALNAGFPLTALLTLSRQFHRFVWLTKIIK